MTNVLQRILRRLAIWRSNYRVVTRAEEWRRSPLISAYTYRIAMRDQGRRRSLGISARAYRQVFEAANALMVLDREGRIVEVNPAAAAIHGYRRKEMLGMSIERFLHPETIEQLRGAFCPAADARGYVCQGKYLHRDGQAVDIEIQVAPLTLDGMPHVLAVLTDIGAQKAHERKLIDYAQALESANHCLEEYSFVAQAAVRGKSEYLANLSHEIRTPITAILGFAELLLAEGDIRKAPPSRIDAIDTVIRNSEHLLRLLNGVLDISKIEAGRFDIERAACSPAEIVADVRKLQEVSARAKQIDLEVACLGPIPESIVTDPTRLRQILINLVSNAIKFTDHGKVRIELRLTIDPKGEDCLEFAVRDSGIGMTPEQQSRLFQPFVQAGNCVNNRRGGTGLGLTISRKLANLLGGDIKVESAPGAGSTFRFIVPVGAAKGARLLDAESANKITRQGCAAPACVQSARLPRPARLLVADDGADNRRLIRLILEKAGATVVAVENGLEAVEAAMHAVAEGNPFDVILMDMQMPELDGYQATRRLRAAGYGLPIIALTAHAMQQDRTGCLEAGCDQYAAKPIRRAELVQLVASCLEATSVPHGLPQAIRAEGPAVYPAKGEALEERTPDTP